MFIFRCSWIGSGTVVDLLTLVQCGPMPFARVAQHWVLQSNSSSSGNDSANAPQAHGLTLDTDFAAVTPSSQYVFIGLVVELTSTFFAQQKW